VEYSGAPSQAAEYVACGCSGGDVEIRLELPRPQVNVADDPPADPALPLSRSSTFPTTGARSVRDLRRPSPKCRPHMATGLDCVETVAEPFEVLGQIIDDELARAETHDGRRAPPGPLATTGAASSGDSCVPLWGDVISRPRHVP
jgi:hypothetical protein